MRREAGWMTRTESGLSDVLYASCMTFLNILFIEKSYNSIRLVLGMLVLVAPSGSHGLPYKIGVHLQERVHPRLVPVGAPVPPAHDADLVRLQKDLDHLTRLNVAKNLPGQPI